MIKISFELVINNPIISQTFLEDQFLDTLLIKRNRNPKLVVYIIQFYVMELAND